MRQRSFDRRWAAEKFDELFWLLLGLGTGLGPLARGKYALLGALAAWTARAFVVTMFPWRDE